eukprot:5468877-Prymnesium_polylepis.1
MRIRPTVGVPSVPRRALHPPWCGIVVSHDRATAGSLAVASLIDEISCGSPVTAELAKMPTSIE